MGGGGGRLGGIKEVEQHPLHLFVFFFFPSIRSAKIYIFVGSILLASCFCKFGPVKNCLKKNNSGFKQ